MILRDFPGIHINGKVVQHTWVVGIYPPVSTWLGNTRTSHGRFQGTPLLWSTGDFSLPGITKKDEHVQNHDDLSQVQQTIHGDLTLEYRGVINIHGDLLNKTSRTK